MNILVIGGGGREHAIAWKLATSRAVDQVFLAPGNPGALLDKKLTGLPLATSDHDALIKFCQEQSIHYTVVGPEVPLASGLVDAFQAAGLKCFGPTQAAAQLESSKIFCKQFLERHNIQTARAASFEDIQAAKDYIDEHGAPIVIKSDGLAAGKGVVVAHDLEEAHQALDRMMSPHHLDQASNRVLIEQFIEGEEVSFMVMVDTQGHCTALTSSQDHKAKLDGDLGPNTGGMGACSPATIMNEAMHARVMRDIIEPTLKGMAAENRPYQGFLYAGLMIAKDGTPYVLEYNCRMGDPETQPILMRLESDLAQLITAALDGRLDQFTLRWDTRPSVGVVLCADGYPDNTRTGDPILGLNDLTQSNYFKCFFAGVKADESGHLITGGGRVLCLTALADDLTQARNIVYTEAKKLHWPGIHYRTDIAEKSINRQKSYFT